MIAVTGAAGLLGNALVRRLLLDPGDARDTTTVGARPTSPPQPVRALVRPGRDTSCFAGLDLEVAEADLGDLASLVEAFRGASAVFHLAGEVSIASKGLERLRKINVEGTRNVMEACRRAGVGRLVYASSIHALVEPPAGTCIDENAALDHLRSGGPYSKSKAEATALVFAAADGLEAVVLYPAALLGPYDFRPSHLGQVIIQCAQRRLGAYVDGAYNFVDVRDVADGMVAAWKLGRAGEGYMLSGHQVSVRELLATVETVTGVPAPRLRLNYRFTRAVSRLIPVYYWVTRQKPIFTTYSLDVLRSNSSASHAKATRELGYSPRPFLDTVKDTVAWFREQGMLP